MIRDCFSVGAACRRREDEHPQQLLKRNLSQQGISLRQIPMALHRDLLG